MKKHLAMFASLAAFLMLAAAAEASPADNVKNAEKSWAAALVAKDYAKLDKLLSDDLIYAHSTGTIENKAEYVAKQKAGKQVYTAVDHSKISVKLYGDTAVAHSILVMKGSTNGVPFDNKLMQLNVWVKQGGNWRLVAHQTTKLDE